MPSPGDTYLPNWAVVMLTDAAIAGGMAELRWELRDLVLSGARNVVVDVAQVEDLSSTALAALLSTHRACRARGGGVIIRNPNRRARDLLQHTGLHRVFLIEESGAETEVAAVTMPEPAEAATHD